jgi:hypothetical protein
MATTIEQVLTTLADLVDSIAGLRVYAHPPDASELPCAYLMPPEFPTEDMGLTTAMLTVEFVFLVPAIEDRYAKQLWKYQDLTGPDSLLALMQSNRNLGFDDVDVYAGAWRSIGLEEMANIGAYGASCTLSISIG